jgi:hypothetical protein
MSESQATLSREKNWSLSLLIFLSLFSEPTFVCPNNSKEIRFSGDKRDCDSCSCCLIKPRNALTSSSCCFSCQPCCSCGREARGVLPALSLWVPPCSFEEALLWSRPPWRSINHKNPYVFGSSLLPLYYKAIVNKLLKIKDKLIFLACFHMTLSFKLAGF